MKDIQNVLKTYEAVILLATVLRHNSTTFDADRRENVAEHSNSLAVLAAAIASDLNDTGEGLDVGMVAQFASVHDLVEAYMEEGDISVYAPTAVLKTKEVSEKLALEKLKSKVGHAWITNTIESYKNQTTAEARFVYALDKIVVHMNVILSDKHHVRPSFSEYLRTEQTARQKIKHSYDKLLIYFEELCKLFRESPHFFSDDPPPRRPIVARKNG